MSYFFLHSITLNLVILDLENFLLVMFKDLILLVVFSVYFLFIVRYLDIVVKHFCKDQA